MREFVVVGIVRGPVADGQIVIEHEDVPGFMPAMTMPFLVRDDATATDLQPGDRVRFRFVVGETSSHAEHFEVIAKATSPPSDRSSAPPRVASSRLRPGDEVPAFSLIDQDGNRVDAAELQNSITLVTFIFTRCPVPDFCPLISRHFSALQELAGREPAMREAVRLWSITIDPEHDRPEVLREYGVAQQADFTRWKFLTGQTAEINRLQRLFAVHVEQNQGTLDHTLATALIGRDGRVVEIWRGNRWQPDEVLQAIRANITSAPSR